MKKCQWKKVGQCKIICEEKSSIYDTKCGRCFVVIDGDPESNGYKFCPYCGGKLVDKTKREK